VNVCGRRTHSYNDQERPGIIEAERNRLREQEGPGLRQEIREGLREEEIEAMHARVKTEIYTETVQALNAGLEEKYKGALERKLEEYKGEVEKRVRGEIKGRIKSEYHGLIEHIEGLSHSLDNVEALDSLSQTITLLHDEKKKYKYFNLTPPNGKPPGIPEKGAEPFQYFPGQA